MNLSELSDYEINKLVAEIKYPDHECVEGFCNDSVSIPGLGPFEPTEFNWCDDDADSFRLMVDNQIMVDWFCDDSKGGYCSPFNRPEGYECENPEFKDEDGIPRAIAECIILMNQGGDK